MAPIKCTTRVIFVDNLHSWTSQGDLCAIFHAYEVHEIVLEQKSSYKYAYVALSSHAKACQAIRDLNGIMRGNRPMLIRLSQRAEDREDSAADALHVKEEMLWPKRELDGDVKMEEDAVPVKTEEDVELPVR
ncbi:hypothetical protein CAC42_4820 [Sphaceloma murrayae]|uniref:RRM domain-containing protein n=1 Tax=Sphaceloma murrayae TaxID=2082308 RepID=A0A2K1QP20_9PEZI|nr:hypothetical protein CAC42_4820 [Sphaceloma murrayae]